MRLAKSSPRQMDYLHPSTRPSHRPKLSIGAALIGLITALTWVYVPQDSRVRIVTPDGVHSLRDVAATVRLVGSGGRHFRVPRSIDATGKRDVAGALTRFIRSVPNNSTITFPHNARYRIDGQVTVRKASGLVINGRGSTFFRVVDGTAKRLRLWLFELVQSSVLKNVKIIGLNPAGRGPDYSRAYEHGIALYGTTDFTVADVRVVQTWGDGVVIQHADKVTPTSSTRIYPDNVVVKDSYFNRNGRAGIGIITGTNISIVHNKLIHAAANLINMEPDADEQVIDGVTIRRNRFDGRGMVSSYGTCRVSNVRVIDNIQVGYLGTVAIWSGSVDPCTVHSPGWRIENNTFMAAGGGVNPYVIRFDHRDDVTVQGNRFHFDSELPGYEVGLFDVNGADVSNNTKSGPGAGMQDDLYFDAASQNIWLNGVQVA